MHPIRSKSVMTPALVLLVLLLENHINSAQASCYFPQEFQGEYTVQSTTNTLNGVQYSALNISALAISIWGNCHTRIGNNFILMLDYGETSCIRCLHLKLRSKNVLQVLASSRETISECYINEDTARANCPSEESRSNAEIILYKTEDMEGNPIKEEYCPLDGRYNVEYRQNDENSRMECRGHESTLDSCPSGSTFNLRFRRCTFPNFETKYDCLGSWETQNGENVIILAEKHPSSNQSLKYRCGLYKKDPVTGYVNLALSRDSTCSTDLNNSSSGFETMVLRPKQENNWPHEVSYTQCSFPQWMIGNWEHVRVEDNTLTYRDHSSFKTYTIKCVAMMESGDKYVVFRRSQCNEEQYNCMKIQKRSNNILEFQLGTSVINHTNDIYTLCGDANFEDDSWITQGRIEPTHEQACPISGEYIGKIPDNPELCAKLWSDCRAPELMNYQVSDCFSGEIYEEREYKCLGHWNEGERLYTYTQRHDVAAGTYECFVGSIIPSNNLKEDIYIKEAGEHCQRHIDPLRNGMRLTKQRLGLYSCIGQDSTTKQETKRPTTSSPPTRLSTTTKPWNIAIPYPTIPDSDSNNLNSASNNLISNSFCKNAIFLLSTIVIRLL